MKFNIEFILFCMLFVSKSYEPPLKNSPFLSFYYQCICNETNELGFQCVYVPTVHSMHSVSLYCVNNKVNIYTHRCSTPILIILILLFLFSFTSGGWYLTSSSTHCSLQGFDDAGNSLQSILTITLQDGLIKLTFSPFTLSLFPFHDKERKISSD